MSKYQSFFRNDTNIQDPRLHNSFDICSGRGQWINTAKIKT